MQPEEKKLLENTDSLRMAEDIIGCKWSLAVIGLIRDGINRPGIMERSIDGLTKKVLNERLRKLVKYRVADKKIFPESPPRVEYYLTDLGLRFAEILDDIKALSQDVAQYRN